MSETGVFEQRCETSFCRLASQPFLAVQMSEIGLDYSEQPPLMSETVAWATL